MRLLDPYTFADYLRLFRLRHDPDRRTAWEHVHSVAMRRLRIMLFVLIFSVLTAIAAARLTHGAAEAGQKMGDALDHPSGLFQGLKDSLTPEEKEALKHELAEEAKREKR